MSAADALVALLLVSGMLATGTALDASELRERLRDVGPLGVALLANLALLPLLALALLWLLDVDGSARTGVLVAAAAPGGGTGALLSLHARGDVAHAVVLQAVLAVSALLVTPLWLAGASRDVDVTPVVVGLVVLQLGPLAAGALLRAGRQRTAERVHPVARRVADVSLVCLVAGLLVTEGHRVADVGAAALLAAGLLVLASLAVVAVPSGPPAVRRATAMTTAVRNLSLGLLVARFTDDPEGVALVVLAYGLVMYVVSAAAIPLLRRR